MNSEKIFVLLIKYDMTEKSGGDRVAANLSNELSRYFNVHLVSINGKGEEPYFNVNPSVIYAPLLKGHERIRKTLLSGSRALKKYVAQNKIDVIMSIGGNVNFFMWYACRKAKIKKVFCEHINLLSALQSRSDTPMRIIGAKTADKIVTLTEKDREKYIEHFKLAPDKVISVANWLDDDLLAKSEGVKYDINSKKLVTVGRLNHVKGFDYLVEVANKVLTRHSDWSWDIWGDRDIWCDGEEYEQILQSIKDSGLEDRLLLKGTTDDMYSLYKQYAIYVMTSRFEGLPMVLLEAKSNCIPAVSFDCPTGPSELITDGVDGFIIQDFDTEKMAEKICELIEDDKKRAEFSSHTKDNLHKYQKDSIVKQWVDLIDALTKER